MLLLLLSNLGALAPGRPIELPMRAEEVHEATLALRSGQSAEVAVQQQGIDVVVDVLGPDGALLDRVDSPNGRQGDEPVSLFAHADGTYRLRIAAISPDEPAARIAIRVDALRSAAATRRLLEGRRLERAAAADWLRRSSTPIAANGNLEADADLASFDALAGSATVVGLGEATHGSREFGDLRLALVQRLVERHGYRLIALEDSASRWRALEPYVLGRAASPVTEIEWGWIGRRSRRQLLDWVRRRNLAHPDDPVRVVGVDPQDSANENEAFAGFLTEAYGEDATAAWRRHGEELAASAAQAEVFGDSSVSAETRAFLAELVMRIETDSALLAGRLGAERVHTALAAARDLAAFADFNSGGGPLHRSRDWHMAAGLMRAVEADSRRPKTVYWGHNAHVSAAATSWGPTGALLRQALGCGYRAVASTFGEGAFVAQVPNDPADRLQVTALPPAADEQETIEAVLAAVRPGAHIVSWRCGDEAPAAPRWLETPRPLRWIGGLYDPATPPSGSYRPYRLTAAFDAIIYFPRVTAEAIPADRPVVPPRPRPPRQ
ncbi:MAG TPA: erythromycin esterase family protein [Allosphingosinicella sp.]